jgi:hypothetical protein
MNSPASASYASLNARAQDLSKRIAELTRIDRDSASVDRDLRLSVYLFLFTTRN